MPPITMFEGEQIGADMLKNAPDGTVYQFQTNGYFEAHHFDHVLRHIVRTHKPGPNIRHFKIARDEQVWKDGDRQLNARYTESRVFPRLLILDNAAPHMSKEAELYAEEHQIRLLYLPANLTHIMPVM